MSPLVIALLVAALAFGLIYWTRQNIAKAAAAVANVKQDPTVTGVAGMVKSASGVVTDTRTPKQGGRTTGISSVNQGRLFVDLIGQSGTPGWGQAGSSAILARR